MVLFLVPFAKQMKTLVLVLNMFEFSVEVGLAVLRGGGGGRRFACFRGRRGGRGRGKEEIVFKVGGVGLVDDHDTGLLLEHKVLLKLVVHFCVDAFEFLVLEFDEIEALLRDLVVVED